MWVRTPALPRTAGAAREGAGERTGATEGASRALERALSDARDRLDERATNALAAPADPAGAFDFLANRSPRRDGESGALFDHARWRWGKCKRTSPLIGTRRHWSFADAQRRQDCRRPTRCRVCGRSGGAPS
jgi:hypothetical protein